MAEFFGNLATFLGGALGGGIGFIVLAVVILVVLLPLALWTHHSQAPVRHSGLERFRASLNTPDEGYNDRIPDRVPDIVPDNVEQRSRDESNQPI